MTPEISYFLGAFALFLVAAVFCEHRQRHTLAILLLTIGGFVVYLAAAKLCPYLNLWDEQYHTLVAKNCMKHPFAPAIYDEAIVPGHDYTNWTCAQIWLHKQPLFLWQIALSFKIFGVSELSLRLPSAIMSALLIPLFYRMAFLLTKRRNTAFFTAVGISCSWFLFRLISGVQGTDHNDVCFVFYITASVWAFCEYIHSNRKWGWAMATGLLAGAAILTKWLVGLLVFLAWGIYLLSEYRFKIKEWKIGQLLVALAAMLIVALPWQIYTLHAFPEMAKYELFYNFQHLNSSVEGHQGSVWFYLIMLPMHYFGRGNYNQLQSFSWNSHAILCYIILIVGLFLALRQLNKTSHRITLLGTMLFVFAFFTASTTKMPAFTFILCFIGFLSIGAFLSSLYELVAKIAKPMWLQGIVLGVITLSFCVYNLNFNNFTHGIDPFFSQLWKDDKATFQEWGKQLPENCYVFNVKSPSISFFDCTSCIPATFYSGRQCYSENPTEETIAVLRAQGKAIAVVRNPWLQEGLEEDSTIIKLDLR